MIGTHQASKIFNDSATRSVFVGPIELHQCVKFEKSMENPGLGGTEYSTVLLAVKLASILGGMRLTLGVVGESISGLERQEKLEISQFENWKSVELHTQVAFVPLQALENLSPSQINCNSLAVVVHHPSDPQLKRIRRQFKPAVFTHVGDYSFWSNFQPQTPSIALPNPIQSPILSIPRVEPEELIVGYLGALVRPKRFHELANAWNEIRKAHPQARLEVVGGASLYGDEEAHPILPTSQVYGDEILRNFDTSTNSLPPGVTFHGNVRNGKADIIRRWTVAVVNPTGNTESFSYSTREILRAGVPVIAGSRQGLAEIMTYFPQFKINRKTTLKQAILSIFENGIDQPEFEKQRQRWLRHDRGTYAKAERALPQIVFRLSEGRSLALTQYSMWPAMNKAIMAALIFEVKLRIESMSGHIFDSLYKKVRKIVDLSNLGGKLSQASRLREIK